MYIDYHKHKTKLLNEIDYLKNMCTIYFLEKITQIKEMRKKGLT